MIQFSYRHLCNLTYPVVCLRIPKTLKITEKSLTRLELSDNTVIDVSSLLDTTYNTDKGVNQIKQTTDFFNTPGFTTTTTNIMCDFVNKKLYQLVGIVWFKNIFLYNTEVQDYYVRVAGIPHPIRHNNSFLQQERLHSMTTYSRIGLINNQYYFLDASYNKGIDYANKF